MRIRAKTGAKSRALLPRRWRARPSAAHAARRELQYDMRLFNRAFEIEENHNLHCRQVRASAVRCVLSPGQGTCSLPSASLAAAHLDQKSSCRRAPAGRLTALGRSTAQWCPRLQICAATRRTSQKESQPNAFTGSQTAPRLSLRERCQCAKDRSSAECQNSSAGSSERRRATRIGHEKASKATTRKSALPRGPFPWLL